MSELTKLSAADILDRIKQRDCSVTEVLEAHLQVIETVNPVINALVEIDESCLDMARAMDNARTETLPPLFGLPVTTKSNIDQAGFANSNGVPAFASNLCTADSPVAANLKHSGAIIVGRSNTPEFSMRWCTSNPLHGVSLNPWQQDATPGGSSGGAAAAVATGMCAIAHGNDLGGSLRYPAFCCGVSSLKPSAGRIAAYNPGATAERPGITQTMSVQGPIARSVADLRLGFECMSQAATSDPLWNGNPGSGRRHGNTLRVGFAVNPFSSSIDPALEDAMQIAVGALRDTGADVTEHNLPDAEGAAQLWGKMLFTETSVMLEKTIREQGSAQMQTLMDVYESQFERLDLDGLLYAMTERIERQRAWSLLFDDLDLLLMPTSLMRPFANDLDFQKPEAIPDIIEAQKPLYTINLLGLPALALPTHLVDRLPVGVQLIAARNDDEFLLDAAEKLERELGTIVGQLTLPPSPA